MGDGFDVEVGGGDVKFFGDGGGVLGCGYGWRFFWLVNVVWCGDWVVFRKFLFGVKMNYMVNWCGMVVLFLA